MCLFVHVQKTLFFEKKTVRLPKLVFCCCGYSLGKSHISDVISKKCVRSRPAKNANFHWKTVLVWIDGAWSGDSVPYKPLFADAGRLKNHAIDAPRVSRWETSDYRWKQHRDTDENSGTCRVSVSEAARYVKDTTKQVIPVTAEVPDATDSLNNEFERVKESGDDVLEQLTQKVAIARDEGRLAEEAEGRELPERPLLEQTTLECARENPSDLGTKVPENEPRTDPVSRLGIVAVISPFAVLWTTRAKWNCLDDKLTRADSVSDEPIVSGYWFKRWNGESDWSGESDWNGGSDWINLCIRDECWCRRSSRRNDASLACGHEQTQRVESASAAQRRGVEHPRLEEREECASGRLVYAQCAQVSETEQVSQQEYSTSTGHGPKLV